ncbi:hypothetical protein ACSSS7_002958 [Eimeria intestinalis]
MMNDKAFSAAVSNLTNLRAVTPEKRNVDTTVGVAALGSDAIAFRSVLETARYDAADDQGLSTNGAALAPQRSHLASDFSLGLSHQQPRRSFASYLPDARMPRGSQSSYSAPDARALVPGLCDLHQNQQQQQQSENSSIHVDSSAADRRVTEKGFGNVFGEPFCDLWGPPREALEQQQQRLESLQQTIEYCDERCTLGRSFRAREAAVRARLLYDQLQKQQQEQRLRHQRNAKLMEEAVSTTSQKLMAPPTHAAQRLALCLTELHKQMRQRLDPPTFSAAAKLPGIGGTSALYQLNVPSTFQQEKPCLPVQGCDGGSLGETARTTFGQNSTSKNGQSIAVLYESAEDLAAAKKSIQARASTLLSQQESANRNNVHSYLLAESGVQARMALQRAKGSLDARKCVTEATTSELGCATCCSSPRIPEELSSTCTKTAVPPSPPQKLLDQSKRFWRSNSHRHKSTDLPRKMSRPTSDKSRRHNETEPASEEHQLLKLNHKASALGGIPLQLHDTQQVRLRQQQSRRHHNIRQSLQSFPEGTRLSASATPVNEASRVLTAPHVTTVRHDSAPSEALRKGSTSALDVAMEQTSQGEQQGPSRVNSSKENHRRQHRRHKQHLRRTEGQLQNEQMAHISKPVPTQREPSPSSRHAGEYIFSNSSSSRNLASRDPSPPQGIHYLGSGGRVSERPKIHSIKRVVPFQQNATTSPTSLKAQSTANSGIACVLPMAAPVSAIEHDNAELSDTSNLTEKHVRHYSASGMSAAGPSAARSSAASGKEPPSGKKPSNKKLSPPGLQPMSTQAICGSINAKTKRASSTLSDHNGTLLKGQSSTNDLVKFLMDVNQGETV